MNVLIKTAYVRAKNAYSIGAFLGHAKESVRYGKNDKNSPRGRYRLYF